MNLAEDQATTFLACQAGSGRMVCECGPVVSGSGSKRAVAMSSGAEYSSGEASVGGEWAAWRPLGAGARSLRCRGGSLPRGSAVRRRVAGADVFLGLLEAPRGRVVNRGGRMGRESLPACGAEQVRGGSFDGAGGHRVDHQIVRPVLAGRLAGVSGLPRGR